MSETKIKNNSDSPFILPNGVRIDAGQTLPVTDWDSMSDHILVRAWVNSNKLEVGKTTEDTGGGSTGNGGNSGGGSDDDAAEGRVRAMTVPELTAAIEKKPGGKDRIKSGMVKDDLVKIALELGV